MKLLVYLIGCTGAELSNAFICNILSQLSSDLQYRIVSADTNPQISVLEVKKQISSFLYSVVLMADPQEGFNAHH